MNWYNLGIQKMKGYKMSYLDNDALEKLRMDYILDLRNGRYDVKLRDVMQALSSGSNDKPLLNEIIKAHEKQYGKIEMYTEEIKQ